MYRGMVGRANKKHESAQRTAGGSSTPDDKLVQVAQQEDKHYQDTYRPLNQQLISEVNSTKMVDSAKKAAAGQYTAGLRRNERQRERYGYNDTALDDYYQGEAVSGAKGLSYDTTVNNSRVDQYERNVGLRNELINMSRGISKDATDGMTTASRLKTQRDNNNANISAQNSAAKSSFIGQAGGMLATAAMLAF